MLQKCILKSSANVNQVSNYTKIMKTPNWFYITPFRIAKKNKQWYIEFILKGLLIIKTIDVLVLQYLCCWRCSIWKITYFSKFQSNNFKTLWYNCKYTTITQMCKLTIFLSSTLFFIMLPEYLLIRGVLRLVFRDKKPKIGPP